MDTEVRKIIHVDMDAFYASIEQRDAPELKGKPVAVGGSRQRGVVAAASYEARKYGVRSAMPSMTAYRLCPDIIFVRPRFDTYRDVSYQIREVFFQYTDLVEPLSLDEAYLDVSENKAKIDSAAKVAREIKQKIFKETNLTASAGVSVNKFLAKVASGWNKPDGLTLIPPEKAVAFIEKLPVEKFHGIGKKTAEKMKKMGIHYGADLKLYSELDLARRFGKTGRWYYRISRGIDNRAVQPDRIRKSVGAENTFREDIIELDDLLEKLEPLTRKVSERLKKIDSSGRTITLKIKYHDFVQTTRSRTVSSYVSTFDEIFPVIKELLYHPAYPEKEIRLLGVSLSNLMGEEPDEPRQLSFDFKEDRSP